jgi:hypothetical protein
MNCTERDDEDNGALYEHFSVLLLSFYDTTLHILLSWSRQF